MTLRNFETITILLITISIVILTLLVLLSWIPKYSKDLKIKKFIFIISFVIYLLHMILAGMYLIFDGPWLIEIFMLLPTLFVTMFFCKSWKDAENKENY